MIGIAVVIIIIVARNKFSFLKDMREFVEQSWFGMKLLNSIRSAWNRISDEGPIEWEKTGWYDWWIGWLNECLRVVEKEENRDIYLK